jgi:tripartite-type tricarboxylate transporter receptor subunit TctC
MKKSLMSTVLCFLITAGLFSAGQKDTSSQSRGIEYPTKSLVIVNPYVAGGAADVILRKIASLMEPKIGKPVVVMNRVGAGGQLAATEYLKEEPNTHTLILLSRALMVTVPIIQGGTVKFSWDDFSPIIGIENIDFILFANKKTGITDMKSLIAYANSKQSLKYGTTGAGTDVSVLQAALFGLAGIKAEPVVYGGAKEALLSAANNVVDVAAATPTAAVDLLKEGSIVPIGIFSKNPYTGFEGIRVPTLKEQGYDLDLPGLNFLAIRSGTKKEIIEKLYTVIHEVYQTPEYQEFAKTILLDINSWRPEEIDAYIRSQQAVIEKFKQFLK